MGVRRWLVASALLLVVARPGSAQEARRITVRVRQVAGSSIYLDVGTRHGLATGDTVSAAADSAGPAVGELVVTASSDVRSVLTFAGEGFEVARGGSLTLTLLRDPEAAPPPAAAPVDQARDASTPPRPPPAMAVRGAADRPAVGRPAPPAHGRIALDMTAIRSVTQVGGADPRDIQRTYATPALRMDVTAPEAVGGFTLRVSARAAYRYSSTNPLQPSTSARFYAASLERTFTSLPLRVALGRFHSRYESYSGFWDGALVRLGGDAVGVGAIVGFEPDRWNERPSAQRPKATAFAEGRARGQGWRWNGDVSAHTVRPRDAFPAHTFLGASQRLSAGPLVLSHDLQLDSDPSDGQWRVSRFRARASLTVAPGVEVRAGASRRESYLIERAASPFAARRDRVDGGVAFRFASAYAAVDVDRGKDASGSETRGATAFLATRGLAGWDALGITGSASRWSGSYGSSVAAAPGFTLDLDGASLRFGYRFSESDYLDRRVVSHGANMSVDAPLGPGFRVSARGRVQWGGVLSSRGLDLTLYRIF